MNLLEEIETPTKLKQQGRTGAIRLRTPTRPAEGCGRRITKLIAGNQVEYHVMLDPMPLGRGTPPPKRSVLVADRRWRRTGGIGPDARRRSA